MMMERPKSVTKEIDKESGSNTSMRTTNEKKEEPKTVDPIELLEKRLAKLGGGLVPAAAAAEAASEQQQSSNFISAMTLDPLEGFRKFQSDDTESSKLNKMALLVSFTHTY